MSLLVKMKDPVSGLTHLGGALLGVTGLIYLLLKALHYGNIWHVVSFSIFGVSVVLLYSSSAFYHLLNISEEARIVFRKIDHSMIFVLIAGSYTPFCLLPLRGPLGWTFLGIIWGLVLLGLILKFYFLHAPRWLSTGLYLVMGWLVVGVFPSLIRILTSQGIFWLVMGGVFYTVGAIIYAIKRPDPFPPVFGFHEIWHLFVLAGTTSHFLSINTLL